jgi:hypothetical protein
LYDFAQVYQHIAEFFLQSAVSDEGCRENKITQFMYNKFSENRAVSEIMWKSAVEPDMRQMAI